MKWWQCSEEFSYRWKSTGTKCFRPTIKESELDTEAEIKNYIHAVENKCTAIKGEREVGGMNWEIGINIDTLLILCIK